MHWATNYIGIPWVFGGRELEEGFDCWGLFRYVQRNHYDLVLPEVGLDKYNFHTVVKNFNRNDELKNWVEVDKPADGDAVLLKIAKYPNHVGVWIEDDETIGVFHTVEKTGAMFSSKQNLDRAGWKIARFYRHKSKV